MRALVTGASQGIGRAISLTLASRGGHLALTASSNARGLAEVADEVREMGGRAVTMLGDIGDPEVPARLVREAVDEFGGLDAVVANAAIAAGGPLQEQSVQTWDRVYAVDVRSVWLIGKAALPHLTASGGSLLAVGSIAGSSPHPGTGPYSSAKAALEMLIRQMAVEWGPKGVRANLVSPGFTVTPRTSQLYDDPDHLDGRLRLVPLNRLADPMDIARAAAFLLSPDAAYCTGQNLVVDGGVLQALFDLDPMTAVSLGRV